MADLFQEVDEAMRAEKWARFWDEHKIALLTAIAALILGTAFFAFWNNYQKSQDEKATTAIIAALDSSDPSAALEKQAAQLSGNRKALALLNAAAAETKKGDSKKAIALYDELIKTGPKKSDFRDLAILQRASLLVDTAGSSAKDLTAQLDPVAKNDQSPWQHEALFLSAFIKGEMEKNYAAAVKDLKTLSEKEDLAPQIKTRTQALQSIYSSQKAKS